MRWPADHPAVCDESLARWSGGAEDLCPEATVIGILRYLPGRRVASLVECARGLAVLKVFASPRARGNDRRLRLLSASIPALVPEPLGADASGHVSLVGYLNGTVFDQLDDDAFVASSQRVGQALQTLHASGVALDRRWTIDDELRHLERRAAESLARTPISDPSVVPELAGLPLVTAHRDCHPRQVVVDGDAVRWIDLDDAALAPAGLDVGNFVAHLRRESAIGARCRATTDAAIMGFLRGYGTTTPDYREWERLSLIRLAVLACSRHRRRDWSIAIEGLIC